MSDYYSVYVTRYFSVSAIYTHSNRKIRISNNLPVKNSTVEDYGCS